MKKKKNATKNEIALPEEYAKLPEWQIRAAILHATSYVEDVLRLKEGDAGYYKKLESAAIKYLDEGIKESLTPHMNDGGDELDEEIETLSNPTTAIAEDVFKLSPVFSIDGIFLRRVAPEMKEKYYQRLRGAVNTLAGLFNMVALKINRGKYGYPKGASPEEKRERNILIFQRIFLVTSICALLENIFKANPGGFDEFLREGLAGKNLNDPKVREEFIQKVRSQVTKEGFTGASLSKIFK